MLLQQAIVLAKAAGKEVMKIYSRDFTLQEKEDHSPVTEADLVSEKIILQGLRTTGFGILSEETKADNSWFKKDNVWFVDPLDGTLDFIQKTGEFTIMIGLAVKKEPVLGVVYQPTTGKLYSAQKGKGAFVSRTNSQPEKLKVSGIAKLASAKVILSRNHCTSGQLDFVKQAGFSKVQQLGSAGLKIGLIAEGLADAYFTESDKTHQWDTAAGEIILKEAGGIVSDLRGEPLAYCRAQTNNPEGLLCCNKALFPKILPALKSFFQPS